MARKRENLSKTGVFGNGGGSPLSNIVDDMEKQAFSGSTSSVDDEILNQLSSRPFKSVIKENNGEIQRGNFVLTMTGLKYEGEELTLTEWQEFGDWLGQLKDSIQWMIGDWANIAEANLDTWVAPDGREFKTRYKDLLEKTDYSYSSLRKFSMVASAFPMFRRRNTLTYSHHAEVAHLDEDEQERFLDLAEANDIRDRWSVRVLREEVQKVHSTQLKSGSTTITIDKDVRILLTRGLELVSFEPELNSKNKTDALKAAEFYRELAEKLEQYARQDDSG
ncbi:MAG: hypothetical protein AAFU54_18685 [Chloroflexota bacterium]